MVLANDKLIKCAIGKEEAVALSLDELASSNNKVVGTKQTIKAIKSGNAKVVFIADDAETHVTEPFFELCKEENIKIIRVNSMKELGKASGIDVGSASAAIID